MMAGAPAAPKSGSRSGSRSAPKMRGGGGGLDHAACGDLDDSVRAGSAGQGRVLATRPRPTHRRTCRAPWPTTSSVWARRT